MGENSTGVRLDSEIQEKESQLTALKAEIKSRQRLLAQLTDQKPDSGLQDKAQRLENEIFIRDRQIDTLNDRVISLDSKLRERGEDKSKSKDDLISKLQSEIAALEQQREDAESKVSTLQTELTSRTKRLEDEAENYRLLQEAEVQEHENTRTRLEMKERQLSEGRGDMVRLAKTIEDLTKINGELGEKIGKLNQEIESARADAFKTQARAQYADELEKAQEQYEQRLKLTSAELAEAAQANEMLTTEKIRLERCISDQEFRLQGTSQTMSEVIEKCKALEMQESSYKNELETARRRLEVSLQDLEDIRKQLHIRESQGASALSDAQQENQRLRVLIKQLEDSGKGKDRDFLKASTDVNAMNARLLERERFIDQLQKTHLEALEATKLQIGQAQTDAEGLRSQIARGNKDLRDSETALSKALTQSALLMNRYEETKVKLDTLQATAFSTDSQIRELKTKLSASHRDRTETEKLLQTKEQRMSQAVHKIKALEEELWNRDSENMKKDAQIVKLSQQFEETKKALGQLNAKMRNTIAGKLAEANRLLEEKETEITLLKEMLRSSQLQLKQKEAELLHSKKRSQEVLKPKESNSLSKASLDSDTPNLKESDLITRIRKFCTDADHLIRFFNQKRRKIEALKDSQPITAEWLQEELKLPYPPPEDAEPTEVLTESVNQRIEFLRGGLATELEGQSGYRLNAGTLLESVSSEKLADLLDGYEDVTLT